MSNVRIQIFTAVEMETRAISRFLKSRGVSPRYTESARHGSAPTPSLLTIGVGACHLPDIDQLDGASVIILCGVAGALDPSLKIGDVVIDGFPELTMPTVHLGPITGSKTIVATAREKALLFSRTGAAAVDMEQSIVREFANRYGLRFINLRAVSDTADQTLDPVVMNLVDDLGRPKPIQIAKNLIRRPSLIPYLWKLNGNTRKALKNLGPVLWALINQL